MYRIRKQSKSFFVNRLTKSVKAGTDFYHMNLRSQVMDLKENEVAEKGVVFFNNPINESVAFCSPYHYFL